MDKYYSPSSLVQFLHGFPHLSFQFAYLENPFFTFDDNAYLESLFLIGLMPVVLLLLSMIFFLIYYCSIKMKRETSNKAGNSCYCSLCLFIIFVMWALGSVGIVSYGTNQMHEGISSARVATATINQSFSIITEEIINIDQIAYSIEVNTRDLDDTYANNSLVATLQLSVNALKMKLVELPYQDVGANDRLEWLIRFLQITEEYRTIITYCMVGFHGFVCLFALLGICFRSRFVLVFTVFLGLFCLVISYLYIGIAIMIDVGMADLCMEPFKYIQNQTVGKNYVDETTADYYLICPHTLVNPYVDAIKNVSNELEKIDKILLDFEESNPSDMVGLILDNLIGNTVRLENFLSTLSNTLDCKSVNAALKKLVPSVCSSTVDGLFILWVAMLSVCFALTVVLCAAPQTWKRFSKKVVTEELDLDDVFHPPAARQPSVSRTNNPLYISPEESYSHHTPNTRTAPAATNTLSFFRHSEEDMTLIDPPPEYSPPSPSDY